MGCGSLMWRDVLKRSERVAFQGVGCICVCCGCGSCECTSVKCVRSMRAVGCKDVEKSGILEGLRSIGCAWCGVR